MQLTGEEKSFAKVGDIVYNKPYVNCLMKSERKAENR